MTPQKFTFTAALVLALTVYSPLLAAPTPATIDATVAKPTIGSSDIYNYATTTGSYVNTDFTNNPYNGQGAPGQTFTATAAGEITAITLQGFQGGAGLGYQSGTFQFDVYSVSGTALTFLGGGNYVFANQSTAAGTSTDYSGQYLTFDLNTPITVTAGNVYAFALSSRTGYYQVSRSATNVYAGGSAIGTNGDPSAAPSTAITVTQNDDRNFDVHIETVPEPGTWAMMIGGLLLLVAIGRRCVRA